MTSQIILGNFDGIVVASDTARFQPSTRAVSLGFHKIFDLGEPHRVVVSISAALWQDRQPVTATLRQWASTITSPLLHIEDYAESFTGFHLSGAVDFETDQSRRNIIDCIEDHFQFLVNRLDHSGILYGGDLNWLEGMDRFTTETGVTEILEDGLEWLSELPNYPAISDEKASSLIEEFELNIDEFIDGTFSVYELNDTQRQILHKSAPMAVSRAQYMPKGSTDLHFVGYGQDDHYPGLVEISNRGTIGNLPMQMVMPVERVHPNEHNHTALIKPIAQDSAISAFIVGADINSVSVVLNQVDAALADEGVPESLDISAIWEKVDQRVQMLAREHFVNPFRSLITAAGIEQLAGIARTMIELQVIRSETSRGPNTVGGEIDVVKISSRGVEWAQGIAAN